MKKTILVAGLFAALLCTPAAADTPAPDWISPGKVMALSYKAQGWDLKAKARPQEEVDKYSALEIAAADGAALSCDVSETITPPDVIMGGDFSAYFWVSQHKLGVTRDNPTDPLYRVSENRIERAGDVEVHRLVTQDVDKPIVRRVTLTFAHRNTEIGVIGIISCSAPLARWREVEIVLRSVRIFGAAIK